MSRQILNDHPWSDDEIAYMQGLNREKDIEKNRKEFPRGDSAKTEVKVEDSPQLKLDPDIFEFVKDLNSEKLQSELRKRDIVPYGDEKQMKVTLAQTLQAERDSG